MDGHLYLLTLTAPGNRRHRNKHTGQWCDCTPEGGVDLADWNALASRYWNHLRTLIRRDVPIEYVRVVEVQERGALHLHVVVWSPVLLDVEQLRPLAIRCGFGHEVDLALIEPGSKRHAYYVAKYVTNSCDQRGQVPWRADVVDQETGEVRRMHTVPTFRTWSASQGWGVRMVDIRSANARNAARRAGLLRQALEVGAPATAESLGPDAVAAAALAPD